MGNDASVLVGTSAVMETVRESIRQAARNVKPVLLVGEIGTGKKLAAQTIHSLSSRSAARFVMIDCSALPESLVESELFGIETSNCWGPGPRVRIKPGRVEQARGGTILVEDVGEVSPAMQLKLLRLIDSKAHERIGSTETVMADVRVVASSHRPLSEKVKAGTFREDLYARLSAVQIDVPSLRDRGEDLNELVLHFLAMHASARGRSNASITHAALVQLAAKRWFGNVRDLEFFIEAMVELAPAGDIVLDDAAVQRSLVPAPPPDPLTREARVESERAAVEDALRKAGGDRAVAARILKVSRRTLYNELEALGLMIS